MLGNKSCAVYSSREGWRRMQEPWGESGGNLGGVVHCVGCLEFCGMCNIPDPWAQNASSIHQHIQKCLTWEACGAPGRTPLQKFVCCTGELEPHSVSAEGRKIFREGSRSDLYFSGIMLVTMWKMALKEDRGREACKRLCISPGKERWWRHEVGQWLGGDESPGQRTT